MNLFEKFNFCPIAFGGASISGPGGGYGFGNISDEDSFSLLQESFDLGIRVFDTAPIYGFGLSEERLGRWAKRHREEVFLVSKCGVDWHDNKRVNMSNDPKIAEKMLRESLARLDTDYIDLYMVHWPDTKFDICQVWEVLVKAKERGQLKHLGLCNTNRDDLEKVRRIMPAEVVQSELNYFQRQTLELLPSLREQDIGFMGWGTFDKGVLTGRVNGTRKFDSYDLRSQASWWKKEDRGEKYREVELMKAELTKSGRTLTEFALGFSLFHVGVDAAICGFRSSAQLREGMSVLPNRKVIEKICGPMWIKK